MTAQALASRYEEMIRSSGPALFKHLPELCTQFETSQVEPDEAVLIALRQVLMES